MKSARQMLCDHNLWASDILENQAAKPIGWLWVRIALMLALQLERMIAELSNIHNEMINMRGRM